jgi:hypothetical protein
MSTKSDGFVIRDCHMGRNTVTAWKIKASNGLFAGNRFEQHGWCCISLFMELMWQEGYAPRNILIENNVFENRFGIWTGCGYPKHGEFGPAWLRGITIRHNEFRHDHTGWAVTLSRVRESEVTGNTAPSVPSIASTSGLLSAASDEASGLRSRKSPLSFIPLLPLV